jgi:glyoxylase-like metal-dependent hydrolase (beta-lactamase superfamily II)
MSIKKIGDHIYLIDLEAGGIRNFVASYVLIDESIAIVETGPASSIPNLLHGLNELNVKPEDVAYIAVTHVHIDHSGGVGTLLRALPKAKVIVHHRGAIHLANPDRLWQQSKMVLGEKIAEIYGKPEPVPMEKIVAASEGLNFKIGDDVALKVIETLGHAPHHLCYYEPLSEGIFTGDAAGVYIDEIEVIVPTTPPPFRLDIALSSLEKLANLKPKVLYYTHFGVAHSALEKLEAYSGRLKLWAKITRQAIKNGENFEAIRKRIFENDEAVGKAREYIKAHRGVLGEAVLNESLEGFISYLKEFGETVSA